MKRIVLFTVAALFLTFTKAQNVNDVLDLLIDKGSISQAEADTLRVDAALRDKEEAAKKKSFNLSIGKPLKITGYTHIRYQILEESGKEDGFDIRRAYIDLKGNVTSYFAFRLQTDFAGSPKIMDAQADLKVADYLNFTFGQQGLPFSLNNVTSNTKLLLADRVQASEAFSARKGDVMGNQNGRDIGITIHGSILELNDLSLIDYRIGLFNGSGINQTDMNEVKDIVGRLLLHPVKGLDLGGSFYYGWTPDSATLNEGVDEEDRIAANQLGLRQRVGFEATYEYSFLNIQAEYLLAKDGEIDKSGWYAQAAFDVLPDKIQLVARYDVYDKNSDRTGDSVANITGGLNFIFNPNATLQLAYTNRSEESNDKVNNIGSIQLQLSF